ncbi:MAG: SDR family oxidoreductase [Clostridia bacterium]|nr:SDR family oxidoreductase [Clostridia bacterium]
MMNKRVLISGGARGIGAATVKYFAEQGDRVAFIYHRADEKAREVANITGAFPIKADVSDAQSAKSAFVEATNQLGGIDILINCAGIAEFSLFTDISDKAWRRMIDTNLSSAFTLSREAAKVMVSQKHGKIINVGSVWGRMGASCEVHYSASKAGLRGLTQALAKELGPSGITVNCVDPGVIDTDMNSMLDEAAMKELAEATPLCRIGKAEDVAAVIGFLASDGASFITGACIPVDGGFPV